MTIETVIDVAHLVVLLMLAGVPALVVTLLAKYQSRPPKRRQHQPANGRPVSSAAALAADRAAPKVLLPPTMLAGISLPCRECGGESPPVPIEKTAVTSVGSGYVVVATCRLCLHPLVSRVLPADRAAELIEAGSVNEAEVVGRFRRELLDL